MVKDDIFLKQVVREVQSLNAPKVDVTASVMQKVTSGKVVPMRPPLWHNRWFQATATAAACLALALAVNITILHTRSYDETGIKNMMIALYDNEYVESYDFETSMGLNHLYTD